MVRCKECGARLVDSAPVCALHGPAEQPAASPDESADPAAEEAAKRALHEAGFEVHSLLGRGGFGAVYGAVRASDGLEVAAKISLQGGDAAEAEMQREAALMRVAQGPRVPALIWHGTLGASPCLVLARVRHKTLAARMAERAGSPLEFAQARRLALGLLDAVDQIHRAGVVHLDLKPENVLADDDGKTSIVDFGLARTLGEQLQTAPEGGEPAGTAEYMSPEQCDDAPDLDARSDVYSVGILLYELIGGAPPFWGKAADVREAQRSRRALPLPERAGVPPAVDAVVRACLTQDRAPRPGAIEDVRQALLKALGRSSPSVAPPPRRSEPPPPQPAARKGRAQAAGVKEKRSVGLLFFESRASAAALQTLAAAHGGEIAQSKGAQYVIAFGHGTSSNPVKPALSAAHRLIGSDVTGKVVVDVAQVTVENRPGLPSRFFGAVLMKQDRYPGAADAPGVMLTSAAVEVLPELRFGPAAGRADRFVLAQQAGGEGELTVTSFGMDGAPLIGRGEILRQLGEAAVAATRGPAPSVFTIAGKSGYGRTHLASTFAESLSRSLPEAEVLRLAPQQDVLGQQGRILPEMLRRLLDLPASVDRAEARALFSQRLGGALAEDVWAAAAFTMGYLDARHPEVDRLAAAPGALRGAAARAAGEALKLRARKRPQVVVLDDAHLADDAVLDALEYATLKEEGAAIFACVFAADDFEERRPRFGTRAARRTTLELGPLENDDAMTLARLLLHPVEHVPQAVLANLVERTQCIPRLLTELIRGLKREGIVRKNQAGARYYVATDELDKLPDLPIVEWNARREIEALPPQLAAHARLAAVLGVDFSVGEMDALASALERAGLAEDMQLDPSVGIARLVDAKILRRHRNGRFDFRTPLLRDTIYETVRADRRQHLHAAAFEVYEAAADMPASRRGPRLALHAARSGQTERAAQEYLQLGQQSLEAQAYLPAEAAFGSALECLGKSGDARLVTAARGRGLMRFRLGRNEDAVRDLTLAREHAHGLGDAPLEADIMLDEATVLDWRYKVEESAALVRAAQQLVAEPDALLEVKLASNLTRVLHRAGDAERCVSIGAEAAEKAARLGDRGYEARVITLLMVAPDYCKLGRFEDAERCFETIIAQAEAHSDLHHLAGAYINRSMLWFPLGRLDRLVRDLESAIGIARKIGDPFLEANALNNLAQVQYWSGSEDELEAAARHAARGLELAMQLWGQRAAAVLGSELLLARIEAYRGQDEEAARLVRSIRARMAAAGGDQAGVGWGPGDEVVLEALELATSGADEARWAVHAAQAAAIELQHEDRLELLECRATAALRAGRTEHGRALYAQAAELARESQNLMSGRVLRNYARRFGTAA
jgi:serine/threonine protein kinase/tetratricopeptide (TPR) repeat protein